MILTELLREIKNRDVTLFPADDRLRFRPKRNLTPELVEGLRQHKAEILECLEKCERPHDPLLNSPVIRGAGEVLELARASLGEMAPEYREEVPYPPPVKGRNSLVHRHTAKARFFRGVRGRDLEKRERDGLPTWIRLDGGGAA